MNTRAVEDYIKAIYALTERGEPVSTNGISEALGVRAASVTGMLRKLSELKLISYEPYRQIELTEAGRKIALEVIRHHRLIELFLTEALGVPWDEVHEEAEKLEHVISESLEDRIDAALGHPLFDPHGDPIPARDGSIADRNLVSLVDLAAGQSAVVGRVRNQSPEVLRHLSDLGLRPGAGVEFVRQEPLNGPIVIRVDRQKKILARALAAQIFVEQTQ